MYYVYILFPGKFWAPGKFLEFIEVLKRFWDPFVGEKEISSIPQGSPSWSKNQIDMRQINGRKNESLIMYV